MLRIMVIIDVIVNVLELTFNWLTCSVVIPFYIQIDTAKVNDSLSLLPTMAVHLSRLINQENVVVLFTIPKITIRIYKIYIIICLYFSFVLQQDNYYI